MRWFSYLAIYFLFWMLSLFFVMPFGVRSHDDVKAEQVPGQVSSAPVNFRPRRIVLRATGLSLMLFALFFANMRYGWVTTTAITDLIPVPAALRNSTIYH